MSILSDFQLKTSLKFSGGNLIVVSNIAFVLEQQLFDENNFFKKISPPKFVS